MGGLNREHHGELNQIGVTRARYAELRRVYAKDKVALQQIDVYEPRSPYQPLFRELRDALISGDNEREKTAIKKLRERYPDI